jgi:hypothetical protein
MHAALQSGNMNKRNDSGDLSVDGRLLFLKWVLNKQYVRIFTVFSLFRIG